MGVGAEELRAVVRSTLPEATAAASAVVRTRVQGVVRKRVPGEVCNRRRERRRAVPTSVARRKARVRRAVLKGLTASVLSTLLEARTPEQDMMRKPVTAAPVLAARSRKSGPVRRRGEGPCRRVAQGRREAGPRRHGPWRGVRAESERKEEDGIEARQVYDAGLRRAKRAGSVSGRRREGCAWR